jgi:hypothetical protein
MMRPAWTRVAAAEVVCIRRRPFQWRCRYLLPPAFVDYYSYARRFLTIGSTGNTTDERALCPPDLPLDAECGKW